jgi:aspartate-semialdehyde dehydrogenase
MGQISTVLLGSSGIVSQYVQFLLNGHPWFHLNHIAGSPNKVGSKVESLPWTIEYSRPGCVNDEVLPLNDERIIADLAKKGVKVAISTLPSEYARDIEPMWAKHGIHVFSNASSYRCREDIPTVVPEINVERLFASGSEHVCATNCTLLSFLFAVYPLIEMTEIEHCEIKTEQALSGGGNRLLDEFNLENRLNDDTIPGEAEKIVQEFGYITQSSIPMDVSCKRVPRHHGHLVDIKLTFNQPVSVDELREKLATFNQKQHLNLPSSPKKLIQFKDEINLDEDLWSDGIQISTPNDENYHRGNGMAVTVGNFKQKNATSIHFQGYSHNLIRGAAGGTILLAELAYQKGLLDS